MIKLFMIMLLFSACGQNPFIPLTNFNHMLKLVTKRKIPKLITVNGSKYRSLKKKCFRVLCN